MRWKGKFIFLVIVYFTGFATAVYFLSPGPDGANEQSLVRANSFAGRELKSDEFMQSFNAGLHKCVGFGKTAAVRMTGFIKQKMKEEKIDEIISQPKE